MGASDLMILEDKLPLELKDKIEVHGQTCMQFWKQMANKSKPPFVKINGKVSKNGWVDVKIAWENRINSILQKNFTKSWIPKIKQ